MWAINKRFPLIICFFSKQSFACALAGSFYFICTHVMFVPLLRGSTGEPNKIKSLELAEEVGSFSDGEQADANAAPDPPDVVVLNDGRSVLIDYGMGKQLLLPGKFEWAVKAVDADKGADGYIIECVSGSHAPRSVAKALSGSKACPLGTTVPAESAPKPRAKTPFVVKVGTTEDEMQIMQDEKLKQEIEAKKLEDAKIQAEIDAKKLEDAKIQAEIDAKKLEDAKIQAEIDAKKLEDAKIKIQAEIDAKKLEDAKIQAEIEAKKLEDAKIQAEMDAKIKAEMEAKKREDAKIKAEMEAKKREDAKIKAEMEAKKREDAKIKAEMEAKKREDAKIKAEMEAKKREDAKAKIKAEMEAKSREDGINDERPLADTLSD